jgi:S-adenosylmethionine hydrolase
LSDPAYRLSAISHTFHGRDIFAPAAAHLAAGIPIHNLGPVVEEIVRLNPPKLAITEHEITGEILNIDHFGNLRTSIHSLAWEEPGTLALRPKWGQDKGKKELRFAAAEAEVLLGELRLRGISETFSDVNIGEVVAFVGSEMALEIAINQGNLAHSSGIEKGSTVRVLYNPL